MRHQTMNPSYVKRLKILRTLKIEQFKKNFQLGKLEGFPKLPRTLSEI